MEVEDVNVVVEDVDFVAEYTYFVVQDADMETDADAGCGVVAESEQDGFASVDEAEVVADSGASAEF